MIQIIINGVFNESQKLYIYTIRSNGDYIGGGLCSCVQILKATHDHLAYSLYILDAVGIRHRLITYEDAVVTLENGVPETVIEDFTVPDEKEKARLNACHGKVIS